MDTVSPESRSRIMSAIHGSGTRPELFVRQGLFARGFRFRVNSSSLPGRPDLKLTRYRAVVLVNGCFWHGHACRYFRPPASNVAFWEGKIGRNRERDLLVLRALREAGWRVCVVWECAVRLAISTGAEADSCKLLDRLEAWIRGEGAFVEFFDASAMREGGSPEARGGRARVARNASLAGFAAEREVPYGGAGGGKG